MATGGNDKGGSSSANPNPNPNSPSPDQSSRRRSTSGSPVSGIPQRPRLSPGMIVRGQSVFSPRPGPHHALWPPAPHAPSSGSATGFGLLRPYGFMGVPGGMPVAVGGGGSPTGSLRLGGAAAGSPAGKKRGRDGGASGSRPAINQQAGGEGGNIGGQPEVYPCSLCPKTFPSEKALFGHLRSHPDRGWKGAHPPPIFNAAEEYRDFPGVNLIEAPIEPDDEEGIVENASIAEEAPAGGIQDEPVEQRAVEEAAVVAPPKMRVPDLNNSPPDSE